jgi:hypothetical protein
MKIDHLKHILFIFLFFSTTNVYSQKQDTVVVYEYIFKTDTVWLESKPVHDTIVIQQMPSLEDATLLIDTATQKADLLYFSSGKGATIPINRIILTDYQQKLKNMKKIAFLGLTFLALNSGSYAQTGFLKNLSLFVKGNLATQLHSYPNIESNVNVDFPTTEKEFGTCAEQFLPSIGVGFASQLTLNHYFSFNPKLSYIQKGCSEPVSNGKYYIYYPKIGAEIGYDTNDKNIQNRFHNLSLDLIFKVGNNQYKKFQPSFYAGIRGDVLLLDSVKYNIDLFDYQNSCYTNFNRFNYGLVSGFGFEMNHNFYLNIEMNKDLGYLVKNHWLKVQNLIFSVDLGIYLNKLTQYRIVKKE